MDTEKLSYSPHHNLEVHKEFIQKPSPTLMIQEEILNKIRKNEEVFCLGFGGNPLPMPVQLQLAYTSHVAKNHYPQTQGIHPLRCAIAKFYEQNFQLDICAEDVFIFPGSKEGIFQVLSILKGPLILPKGSWVSYAPQACILKKEVLWVDTYEKDDYKLCPKELEKKCQEIQSTQKILILNSPNNPTGHIYSKYELEKIALVCERYNIFVIFDSIYAHPLDYEEKPFSFLTHFCPERVIITAGLSKIFSCGGWRLGFLILPKTKKMEQLTKSLLFLMSETISGVNVPLQYAATEAYSNTPTIKNYLTITKQVFSLATKYMWQKLCELKLKCPKPQGGFYVLPNFKEYKKELAKQNIFTSKELDLKLRDLNIYALPGEDFGLDGTELAFRFAIVDFDGASLLDAVSKNPSLLSLEKIPYLMPKLEKTCSKIAHFLHTLKS